MCACRFQHSASIHVRLPRQRSQQVIHRLRFRSLLPAVVVSAVLAAAFALPTVGAHLFVASAYCSGVTLVASPPSPQPSGTQVTLTANGTCPNANPMYEFWARWSGSA